MVEYNDVKDMTTEEYFNGNEFSIDIFNKKYRIGDETYVKALKRVCDYIASAEETDELKAYWSARWFSEIFNDWWHPAGSIMQGANSGKKISMSNCTTISLGVNDEKNEWDNLESIFKNTAYTVARTASFRQGLGADFSRIRPKNLTVMNSSSESSGSVHWMKLIDSLGNYIGQKSRIPAMLFSLNISHPDVEEFIGVKSDYTKIQNANISVQITNDFMEAVKTNSVWKLHFEIPEAKIGDKLYFDAHSIDMDCLKDENGRYYKLITKNRPYEKIENDVNARELLELVAKNMLRNAEPGIQFIDMAKYWSNSDYVYDENSIYDSRIISTNACSEQYLSRESLCVLASINCGRFSVDNFEEELSIIAPSINRFLDNVNEMEYRDNTYATPHQRIAIEMLRRTGAGVTNLSGWLFKNNLEYGSKEGNEALDKFNETYNYYLYKSSIEIGKEKGNFGLFDEKKYINSPFIKHMMNKGLSFKTMRNVTCSSIAPTGSLSTMFRDFVMSYGVEPAFGIYFWKRTRISGKYEYYFCVPNVVREYFKSNGFEIPMTSDTIKDTWDGKIGAPIAKFIDDNKEKLGIKFKGSTEIKVQDKLDLMSKLMKNVDSSISVTYTLPESSTWKDTYDLIVGAYEKGVKSIAAFPDKKMYGIISFVPFKELAVKLIKENVTISEGNLTEDEKKDIGLIKTLTQQTNPFDAPKRTETLDSDIYVVTSKGKKYIISVGFQDDMLFEIFGGVIPEHLSFKFTHKHGKMTKVKKGHYKLEIGDDIIINDFGSIFTAEEQVLFRMISTSLRHKTPLKFIVQQLSKSSQDISSLTSAVGRVLKKYIKDGEVVNGNVCPVCGNKELIYGDGCVGCSCGWAKC